MKQARERKARPLSLQKVVERGLCCGCGVCAYLQPEEIRMVDVLDQGLRPRPIGTHLHGLPDGDGAEACPGSGLSWTSKGGNERGGDGNVIAELRPGWGPVHYLWEGFASDAELRYSGSSGGVASALALYALEACGYHGVLHVGAAAASPYRNETVVSRSRKDLLARTGSRYSPASPCDGLQQVEAAPGRFMFLGKPCDVAATQKARRLRPDLDRNLGMTVTFFCAGTPSTEGTMEMLEQMGVPAHALTSLRYRGNGWPGRATAIFSNADGERSCAELTYADSWGSVLSKHVQWRCRLCGDHTGEFADIAVGDPWYREITEGEPGSSLILARSERGRQFVESAIARGYLEALPAAPDILPRSQPNLLRGRGAVWGRVMGLRLIGASYPRYQGLETFQYWRQELTLREKLQSLFGTIRRCVTRGLHPWSRHTSGFGS